MERGRGAPRTRTGGSPNQPAVSARPAAPTRPTHAVRHAVAILRTFSPEEAVLGVNEIARRVGLDRSTVSRLLQTLDELALVARDAATGGYRLGMGLVELAGYALANLDVREVAQPQLRRLNAATRETVNLAILDRDEAVIVEHLPGLEPIKALGWVGRRHPLHCTSVGKVLLAFGDEALRSALLAAPLASYTEHTIADPGRLRAELGQVVRQGYAINRGEYQDGLSGVAAPVWGHGGALFATVGVAGPTYRLTTARLRELGEQVGETAAALSRSLGARGARLPAPTSAAADRRADAARSAPAPGSH